MKLLIVNQHVDNVLGGSEIQCDLIAKNLTKMGHEVIYVAINSKEVHERNYQIIPVPVFTTLKFRTILKDTKPDIVYWRFNKKHLLKSSLLCYFEKIPVVFSISSLNDVSKWSHKKQILDPNIGIKHKISFIKSMYLGRINYYAYNFISGVVSLRSDFLDVIPNNIEMEDKIQINDSMDIHFKDNFHWRKPFVVWVANIKKSKNPEIFIDLAKCFIDEDVDFIMIGNIQDPVYTEIIENKKNPDNFFYLGPKSVSEVDSILSSSLFMVHTCEPEGFGNNFIQAWLVEKPTITLYFDPDNIIKENKIGYHSENFEKLQADTRNLIVNNQLRNEMGIKAKKIAEDRYKPENNVRKLELFLESIINNKITK